MVTGIEIALPGIVGKEYCVSSPRDENYNFIALAAYITKIGARTYPLLSAESSSWRPR